MWCGTDDILSQLLVHCRFLYLSNHDGRWGFKQGNPLYSENSTHIPTGSEFCERVAEILGIEKPVFGESLLSGDPPTFDEIREANVFGTVSGSAPSDATKEALSKIGNMPVNPAHKTYRVLDSLDGIPFDTRIPLSEWTPPMGVVVKIEFPDNFFTGYVDSISRKGIKIVGKYFECNVGTDGHWMRIV